MAKNRDCNLKPKKPRLGGCVILDCQVVELVDTTGYGNTEGDGIYPISGE